MSEQEVAEKVKQIIVDKLSVEETEVTNEASFTNDLGADSLDLTELIMAMEEAFALEIASFNKSSNLIIFHSRVDIFPVFNNTIPK